MMKAKKHRKHRLSKLFWPLMSFSLIAYQWSPAAAETRCSPREALMRLLTPTDSRLGPLSPQLSAKQRLAIHLQTSKYMRTVIGDSLFVTHRGAKNYVERMRIGEDTLMKAFEALPRESHVIDFGAGQVNFIRELADPTYAKQSGFESEDLQKLKVLVQEKKLNLSAVTLTKLPSDDGKNSTREWARRQGPDSNVAVHSGRYFENLEDKDLSGSFGQVSLGVDYLGILTYTLNLPLVAEKTARIFKPGGDLWFIADSSTILVKNRGLSVPEYLVETGLFEKVNWQIIDGETTLAIAHLRRTNKAAYKPELFMSEFRTDNGGPPSIVWTSDTRP